MTHGSPPRSRTTLGILKQDRSRRFLDVGSRVKAAIAVLALLLLASCSSSKKPAPISSAPSSPAFTTTYGQDAALIASHVPDCTDVAAGDIGGGADAGGVSLAHCTMLGHQVSLYTWKDETSEASAISIDHELPFSASGTGWTEVLADTGATDVQKQIAQAFADALDGKVETS
jgi:hypothetical protein